MKRYSLDRRSLLRHSMTGALGLTALPYLGGRSSADDTSHQ
ncbi:MAG TPA: hydroxypyruvate isomerase, partial [Halomonas sp.]|nr:hydroxypyruvate isomerase [Halomonas sp.]